MLGALALSVIGSSSGFGGSVVGGIGAPAVTATPTPTVDPLRPGVPIATTAPTPPAPTATATATPKATPTTTPPARKGGGK